MLAFHFAVISTPTFFIGAVTMVLMALSQVSIVEILQCASTLTVNKIRQPQSNKQTDKHHAPDTLQIKDISPVRRHSYCCFSPIFSCLVIIMWN